MAFSKIAIIGNGGREHAICWKLRQSPSVTHIYVIPGNGGTELEEKVTNVKIDVNDFEAIVSRCKELEVDLVVVGPEVPLANGITEVLRGAGLSCFGPTAFAARIESDKQWAKLFMDSYGIPTARWYSFDDSEEAKRFIIENVFSPTTVIKASGLAAGKGVIVAKNKRQACLAVDEIMWNSRKFGKAGDVLVIEEFLEGEEVSVLAFTDGKTVRAMLPVQDHKRLLNNDEGPNTGGMGAFCPFTLSKTDMDFIQKHVLQKAVDGLRREECPFVGVLYAGLMMTSTGIKVLEFNCRFGDPEAEVLMPLLQTDLLDILKACCNGTLDQCRIHWKENLSCISVVMASEGYPETAVTGRPITGLSSFIGVPNVVVFHAATSNKNGEILTNGGRVLNVVAVDETLQMASIIAVDACSRINFTGRQYRTDIAYKGIPKEIMLSGNGSYKSAGVDITSGNELIDEIRPLVENTYHNNVLSPLGSFGAVVDAQVRDYFRPLLVSGCDGVGTKLKIAQLVDKHGTIGQDLVAMCVNDILAHGARPLFFLDYFSCGKLNTDKAREVIKGIADGCKLAGCALVGGETAEMPGFYSSDEYDLAGFAVGIVDQGKLLPKEDIKEGDKIVYLPSSGIHSNGFSLVRKIMTDSALSYSDVAPFSPDKNTFAEEFLKPTRIYVRQVLPLAEAKKIKAYAHITGGGLEENVIRVIPANLKVELDARQWEIPPVFAWIATQGTVSESEMLRTFNCGVGAIVVISPQLQDLVCGALNTNIIGVIKPREPGENQISIHHFAQKMTKLMAPYVSSTLLPYKAPKRVAVLISGSGTNMKALIESTLTERPEARIVVVICSRDRVRGLDIALGYRIPSMVIKRNKALTPEDNDRLIHKALVENKVDIVCLAGYMHILSEWLVNEWRGKMLNVHPSLLPSFKGLHAQKQALEAGVKISGCSVHFVEPEVDAGAIIEQASVPVYEDDTEDSLTERIKEQEHIIFPRALKLVASKKVILNLETGKIIRHK